MSGLKFRRKLGTTWVFQLTAIDRTGNRQSVNGQQLNARLLKQSDKSVIWTETAGAGVTIDETGVPTWGDFTYRRTNLTGVVAGEVYLLDFAVTISGEPMRFPEGKFIVVESLP